MFKAGNRNQKKTNKRSQDSSSAHSLELTVLQHGARDLEPSFVSGENTQVFERAPAGKDLRRTPKLQGSGKGVHQISSKP